MVKKGCDWWESPGARGEPCVGTEGHLDTTLLLFPGVVLCYTETESCPRRPPSPGSFMFYRIWRCCRGRLNWWCSLIQLKTSNYCFRWVVFHQISSSLLAACISCQICCDRGVEMHGSVLREGRPLLNVASCDAKLHPCLITPSSWS